MKSWAILLHPAWDWIVILLSVSALNTLPARYSSSSCLSYETDCHSITVLVLKKTSFYQIMAPKGKSSDAGSSDMPKRKHKVYVPIRKNTVCVEFSAVCSFRHPVGVSEHIPHGYGETAVVSWIENLVYVIKSRVSYHRATQTFRLQGAKLSLGYIALYWIWTSRETWVSIW